MWSLLVGILAISWASGFKLAQLTKAPGDALSKQSVRSATTPVTQARNVQVPAETFVQPGDEGKPGMYFNPASVLAANVLSRVPALRDEKRWYRAPLGLRNGHMHTIMAKKARRAPAVSYARTTLETQDGGSLAFDLLTDVRVDKLDQEPVRFVSSSPTSPSSSYRRKPFLLLVSGLGGGSSESYVRRMAATAHRQGWRVGVLNMRGCGGSTLTSPQIFSAFRGSTDDVRCAIEHIRRELLAPAAPLVMLGWSNGGNVVNNLLAEQETTHLDPQHRVDAAATVCAPLDLQLVTSNLQRPVHQIYTRLLAKALVSIIEESRHLFEDKLIPVHPDSSSSSSSVDLCSVDVDAVLSSRTVEELDESLTSKLMGYSNASEYYSHASSAQRLQHVRVPLLLIQAQDDPIVPSSAIPYEEARRNPMCMLAVTRNGGHLGWCEMPRVEERPFPQSAHRHRLWVEEATLGFLGEAISERQIGKPSHMDT